MLTQDQILGKWKEFKGGVRNLWGEISEEELDRTQGNISQVKGLVSQKYDEGQEVIQEKMDRLLNSFDNDTDKFLSPDSSSYQRNPTQPRSSSTSQIQDQARDVPTRSRERAQFEKKKFEEGQDNLH